MRLIDADEFLKQSTELYEHAGWDEREVHFSLADLRCNLEMMPTVKAEPERGHWIDEGVYADNFPHHAWRCSKCGWHELEIEEPYGNYCRNCGAKIERKEE